MLLVGSIVLSNRVLAIKPLIAQRSATAMPTLYEESCCPRLRRAWEVHSGEYDAKFDEERQHDREGSKLQGLSQRLRRGMSTEALCERDTTVAFANFVDPQE